MIAVERMHTNTGKKITAPFVYESTAQQSTRTAPTSP